MTVHNNSTLYISNPVEFVVVGSWEILFFNAESNRRILYVP